ncbi:hypothetical protein HORIV_34200 [Vreelandella olivaria]|uniref:Uncharacterized protein n=1 Tax=Vreelandella olivaria TaxID=390919 RepID=A0ABM7GKK6_9GAMM|nr:hypothetical protein HORIV_34200 [Halomonas olivaria]
MLNPARQGLQVAQRLLGVTKSGNPGTLMGEQKLSACPALALFPDTVFYGNANVV